MQDILLIWSLSSFSTSRETCPFSWWNQHVGLGLNLTKILPVLDEKLNLQRESNSRIFDRKVSMLLCFSKSQKQLQYQLSFLVKYSMIVHQNRGPWMKPVLVYTIRGTPHQISNTNTSNPELHIPRISSSSPEKHCTLFVRFDKIWIEILLLFVYILIIL